MYPPSMLSSAALAYAAKVAQSLAQRDDYEFDFNDLVSRLQILTRVENVSRRLQFLPFYNNNLRAYYVVNF